MRAPVAYCLTVPEREALVSPLFLFKVYCEASMFFRLRSGESSALFRDVHPKQTHMSQRRRRA